MPAGVDGRLRSLCGAGDPICGEGTDQALVPRAIAVGKCLGDLSHCPHGGYADAAAQQGGDFLADLVIAGHPGS